MAVQLLVKNFVTEQMIGETEYLKKEELETNKLRRKQESLRKQLEKLGPEWRRPKEKKGEETKLVNELDEIKTRLSHWDINAHKRAEIKIGAMSRTLWFEKFKLCDQNIFCSQNEDPQIVYPLAYEYGEFWRFKEGHFFLFKGNLYYFEQHDQNTTDEKKLLVKKLYFKADEKFRKLRKEVELFERLNAGSFESREPIPQEVRFAVWRRHGGKCVSCGSNKKLEYDHIIPVSKGGNSTERNIQLLCEKCSRSKSANI